MVGWIVFVAVLALFLVVMGCLYHEATRPITEFDDECSRIDVDLDEIRARAEMRHWNGSGWRN